ncbi:MAG: acyltransferase, partial [Herbaspirillum sp.]|nr:acyltransferase [Herbaspirillum sp.]
MAGDMYRAGLKQESIKQSHTTFSDYRADIDGLRALAILSVIGFHAFPEWFKGGFIGVDIFFVISGYLISSHIFNGLVQGSFSFIDFYGRRIRRIFPALILVLLACLIFGWFALLSSEYRQLGKHAAGGAGFVSNLIYWQESGYFDADADLKPFLHLWSLGVEEQFYIVWPIILWAAWKLRTNLLAVTLIVAIGSFLYSATIFHADPVADFYSPLTRFWELLVGTALAYGVRRGDFEFRSAAMRNYLSLFAMTTIVCSALFISKGDNFPGFLAILPVAGTALLIAVGQNSWISQAVLMRRIVVWFGLISFPLYLWHWPLLSFARIVTGDTPSILVRAEVIIISIAFAYATYLAIERPIRFGPYRNMKALALIFLMAITGSLGYSVYKLNGLESRPQVVKFQRLNKIFGYFLYPDHLQPFSFRGRTLYRQDSARKETTLFIGDSNMQQYYVRSRELIRLRPNDTASVIFAAEGGCLPIKHLTLNSEQKRCLGLLDSAFDLASSDQDITKVVISGLWTGWLSQMILKGQEEEYLAALSELEKYMKDLRRINKEVFLILPIPTGKEIDPHVLVRRHLTDYPSVFYLMDGGVSIQSLDKSLKYFRVKKSLENVAKESGASIIDPM